MAVFGIFAANSPIAVLLHAAGAICPTLTEPSVVSAVVKASGTYPEQAGIKERTGSEPVMTHRYL